MFIFVSMCMCVYTPFIDRTCLSTVYRVHLKNRLKAIFQSLFEAKLFTLTAYRMTRQQFYKTHSLHSTGTTRPTLQDRARTQHLMILHNEVCVALGQNHTLWQSSGPKELCSLQRGFLKAFSSGFLPHSLQAESFEKLLHDKETKKINKNSRSSYTRERQHSEKQPSTCSRGFIKRNTHHGTITHVSTDFKSY